MSSSVRMLTPFAGVFVRADLRPTIRFRSAAIAIAIVAAAALLRLVWVEDMEYKRDEMSFYASVQSVQEGEPWPLLGQATSQKVPAHGMMIWVFLILDAVFPTRSPTDLARICQWMNVTALAGLLAFVGICLRGKMREVWLWAAAVAAVNPVAVMLQRKIWTVSITPCFTLAVLIGYWHRNRRWGAFLWGAGCMILGMLHTAGLFLDAALVLWAFLHDRRSTRWRWWAAGSALTGWGFLPWIHAVLTGPHVHATGQMFWWNPLTMAFYVRWLTEPFGVSVQYNLGADFADFLRYPLIGSTPTYLMAGLHVVMAATVLYVLGGAAARSWRNRFRRAEVALPLEADERSTRHLLGAEMFGFGAIFTVTFLLIRRHYMLLTFPMMYVWLAYLALADRRPLVRGVTRGQAALAVSIAVQFAVSVGVLGYLHAAERTIRGDYGTPYSAQVRYGLPPK